MKAIGKHKQIIEYVEFANKFSESSEHKFKGNSYLALKYAQNKTLLDYLMSKKGMIEEKWVRYWFLQILKGLQHINNS
jgi:serine/threonine protein kinase